MAIDGQEWHTKFLNKAYSKSGGLVNRYPGRCREGEGKTMSKVDELKTEIERLPKEEFVEIVRWLSEKDWERWDKEIEADSEAGRLDFLMREALDEKAKGTLKDL